ncbi:hypothetical protein RhiirA4_425167 [Rhizophagus irregularis]|uniref:Serine-threonine/tyrosine-protein kinase catalytic domain-containing protein n=1 Tax=Rhizophagus irregularis TaxID=588596 RepID=A0A2I1H092_9GLOM|nr:hypothetical protein RhiirA4_425167 [Rhizophagus irregularis]
MAPAIRERIFYGSKFVAGNHYDSEKSSSSDNIIRLGLSDLDEGQEFVLGYHFYMIVKFFIKRLDVKYYAWWFIGSAPEKLRQGTKVKFSSKCDIFSFSMLLWKIAFDVIPYRNWNYTNIIDRIKADGNDDPIPEATVIYQ